MRFDVLVIGAGVAGLVCARSLAREGIATVVLEARDRVGGRILSLRLPDETPFELGAQVVHGDRAATWSIIREAGLRTARLSPQSEILFYVEGRVWSLADLQRARVPLPWSIEQRLIRARSPDHGVAKILQSSNGRGVGQVLALEWIAQTWCANPTELSVAGMKRVREASLAGEGEFKILGGYDNVPRVLARGLDVRLRTPARLVRWRAGQVNIVAADETFEARVVVVTVPPSVIVAGGIVFDPPLPARKSQAVCSIGTGDALVVVARLAEPSPRSVWALIVGQWGGIWRAEAGSRIVRGWINGPAARRLAAKPLTGELFATLVGGVFHWVHATAVHELHAADWSADQFALGGYSFPKAGQLYAPAQWAAPVGETLFFAGEATCSERHLGLVHGALESGVCAANEVMAAFGRDTASLQATSLDAPDRGNRG